MGPVYSCVGRQIFGSLSMMLLEWPKKEACYRIEILTGCLLPMRHTTSTATDTRHSSNDLSLESTTCAIRVHDDEAAGAQLTEL